jgi:hypothetical protein
MDVVYSPPIDMPCNIRKIIKIIGAAIPQLEELGSNPMHTVGITIRSMEIDNENWRPNLSPMGPKIADPTGRKNNPTDTARKLMVE